MKKFVYLFLIAFCFYGPLKAQQEALIVSAQDSVFLKEDGFYVDTVFGEREGPEGYDLIEKVINKREIAIVSQVVDSSTFLGASNRIVAVKRYEVQTNVREVLDTFPSEIPNYVASEIYRLDGKKCIFSKTKRQEIVKSFFPFRIFTKNSYKEAWREEDGSWKLKEVFEEPVEKDLKVLDFAIIYVLLASIPIFLIFAGFFHEYYGDYDFSALSYFVKKTSVFWKYQFIVLIALILDFMWAYYLQEHIFVRWVYAFGGINLFLIIIVFLSPLFEDLFPYTRYKGERAIESKNIFLFIARKIKAGAILGYGFVAVIFFISLLFFYPLEFSLPEESSREPFIFFVVWISVWYLISIIIAVVRKKISRSKKKALEISTEKSEERTSLNEINL
ncbi:hypothetical protein B6U91_01785 [Candidatus Pacearchaeota archaeon ex4484_71]|nr:MAG: hypothetical protein B6U91_01785 [Candidatus Pacearchaeota archaeon ex4484_71]